jgi:hypothetical protein
MVLGICDRVIFPSTIDESTEDSSEDSRILYIGDQWSAINREHLNANNIKYIINATPITVPQIEDIKYLQLALYDEPGQDILDVIPLAVDFINKANPDHGILIHCQAGISRSASILIAYMMHRYNMKFEEAFGIVKKSRPIVEPNVGFKAQLKLYETLLNKDALIDKF